MSHERQAKETLSKPFEENEETIQERMAFFKEVCVHIRAQVVYLHVVYCILFAGCVCMRERERELTFPSTMHTVPARPVQPPSGVSRGSALEPAVEDRDRGSVNVLHHR